MSTKKVVGYIRVSKEEQARKGISLDTQLKKIRGYCEVNELSLVSVRADEVSGKSIKGRLGIQEVLAMVRSGQVSGIVVYRLDRVARNAQEAWEIANLLQKHGADFHSIREHIDTGSATGRMFYGILATMAQWERELISERIADSLARKREKMEKTGGDVPYGYRVVTRRRQGLAPLKLLEPEPTEQAMIERIVQLRAKGYTLRGIVETLTEEGTFNRKGRAFTETQIRRILKREAA